MSFEIRGSPDGWLQIVDEIVRLPTKIRFFLTKTKKNSKKQKSQTISHELRNFFFVVENSSVSGSMNKDPKALIEVES